MELQPPGSSLTKRCIRIAAQCHFILSIALKSDRYARKIDAKGGHGGIEVPHELSHVSDGRQNERFMSKVALTSQHAPKIRANVEIQRVP